MLAIFAASAAVRALGGLRIVHVKVALVVAVLLHIGAWRFAYPLRDAFAAVAGDVAPAAASAWFEALPFAVKVSPIALHEALAIAPGDPVLLADLASLEHEAGNVAEAIDLLEALVARRPENMPPLARVAFWPQASSGHARSS